MYTLKDINKVVRYIQIYGISRTFNKVSGRLRLNSFSFTFWSNQKSQSISLIGCGQFAFSTIMYFLQKKGIKRFRYAYDIDHKASASLAKRYNFTKAVDEVNTILNDEKTMLVFIASNHASHADYTCQCLKYGKNVYTEKPIAVTIQQLVQIEAYRKKFKGIVYAGYNRPYSKAFKLLKQSIATLKTNEGIDDKFSINFHVCGHKIESTHWYRKPEEGTRVCGNIGHWLDATIHFLAWRSLPELIFVHIDYSNKQEPDDNINITLTTNKQDIITIMLTARSEPFEGIYESINLQYNTVICKIDDFRSMKIWNEDALQKFRFFPKDVGHKRAVTQPFFTPQENRDWDEVILSSLLMLAITDMVKKLQNDMIFDIAKQLHDFNYSVEQQLQLL